MFTGFVYMVFSEGSGRSTSCLTCLHGLRLLFLVIYIVFMEAVSIYMGVRLHCHVNAFAPHVEYAFTWVYML